MKTLEILLIAALFVIGCQSETNSTISYDDIVSGFSKSNIHNAADQILKALRLFYDKSYTLIESESPRLASALSTKVDYYIYLFKEGVSGNNEWTDCLIKLEEIMMPLVTSFLDDFMQLPKRIQLKIGRYGVECAKIIIDIEIGLFTSFLDQEESKLRLKDPYPYQHKYNMKQKYAAKQDYKFHGKQRN